MEREFGNQGAYWVPSQIDAPLNCSFCHGNMPEALHKCCVYPQCFFLIKNLLYGTTDTTKVIFSRKSYTFVKLDGIPAVGQVAPLSSALSFPVKIMTNIIAKQSETLFLKTSMLTKKYRKATCSCSSTLTSKRTPSFTSYTELWNSCKFTWTFLHLQRSVVLQFCVKATCPAQWRNNRT